MSIAGDNSSASCPRSCGVIGFRRREVNVNGAAQLLDGVVFVFVQSEVVVNDGFDVIFELLPGVEVLGCRKHGSIRVQKGEGQSCGSEICNYAHRGVRSRQPVHLDQWSSSRRNPVGRGQNVDNSCHNLRELAHGRTVCDLGDVLGVAIT